MTHPSLALRLITILFTRSAALYPIPAIIPVSLSAEMY